MIAATALATAREASPSLVAHAVMTALARVHGAHAERVIVFLSPDFSNQTGAALRAASRAAQCLQVGGAVAPGVLTEQDWSIDGPAAAVLVLCGAGAGAGAGALDQPAADRVRLSLGAGLIMPTHWRLGTPRLGALFDPPAHHAEAPVFAAGRLAESGVADLDLPGVDAHVAVSTGQRRLSPWLTVDAARDFQLTRLDGMSAVASAARHEALAQRGGPRSRAPLTLWCRAAADVPATAQAVPNNRGDDLPTDARQVDIIGQAGSDGLIVAEPLQPGMAVAWAVRDPCTAEREMHAVADQLTAACPQPAFGLVLACIGRGPIFHGGEDRDWLALRTRFPELPMIGAYCGAQIAPTPAGNRLLRNSVVVGLCETHLGN